MKVQYVCENCKGSNVHWEGLMRWDPVSQEQYLDDIYDDAVFCHDCKETVKVIEIPFEETP